MLTNVEETDFVRSFDVLSPFLRSRSRHVNNFYGSRLLGFHFFSEFLVFSILDKITEIEFPKPNICRVPIIYSNIVHTGPPSSRCFKLFVVLKGDSIDLT